MDMQDRPLPGHPDAEMMVIGTALCRPEYTKRLVAELKPDEFVVGAHQTIWHVITDMVREQQEVSLTLVSEELRHRGKVSETDMSYLHRLLTAAGMADEPGLDGCVKLTRDAALSRRLILCGEKISSMSWTEPPENVLVGARTLLQDVAEATTGGAAGLSPSEQTLVDVGGMDGLFAPDSQGVPTPWSSLNKLTLGLHPGQMIVLAGRTGKGKSAAMAQMASHAALRGGGAVAVFSLEMQAKAILRRMACQMARVDASGVRNGRCSQEERQLLGWAVSQLAGAPLHLSDRMQVTIPAMYRSLQQLQGKGPIALACVDYLQLMSTGGRVENRQMEIAAISRALKQMAVEFGIPVLVLCQYNREADQGGRPALHHIRESGAIGHDADTAWLLHEPEGTDGPQGWVSELIVEKQREGSTGTVRLFFHRRHTRFEMLDTSSSAYEA